MNQTSSTVWLSVVGLIAVFSWAPPAWAEESAKPADKGVPVQVDADLPPIEVPPEILEQLDGMASESSDAMAEVTRMLSENIANIKNAEAIFDRMIQTIRNAAATGAPDSRFVAKIEELAAMARTDAAEARQLGDMEKLAEWFTKQAADFEEAKGEAIAIYTSSFKKIREIEREKQRFLLAMKVKQYGLAKQNINKGLEVLKGLDRQIGIVYDKLPAPEAEVQ